jgi:hypothetical protein
LLRCNRKCIAIPWKRAVSVKMLVDVALDFADFFCYICGMEQEQKIQPLSTSEKLFGVMARLNITRDTLAKLLGTTRTPLDVWLSGTRKPSGAAAMLVDMLADLPEAEEWLIAKYEAEHGEPLPRKSGRWEHRTKLRAADVCEERAI